MPLFDSVTMTQGSLTELERSCWDSKERAVFGGQDVKKKNWPSLYCVWKVVFICFTLHFGRRAHGKGGWGATQGKYVCSKLDNLSLDPNKVVLFFVQFFRGWTGVEPTSKFESFLENGSVFLSILVKRGCWKLSGPEHPTVISGVCWGIDWWQRCSTKA